MRIGITIPEELNNRMVDYKEKTGVPKATLIQMAVTQYLDGQKMLESMPELVKEMKKMMEEAKSDTETKTEEEIKAKKKGITFLK